MKYLARTLKEGAGGARSRPSSSLSAGGRGAEAGTQENTSPPIRKWGIAGRSKEKLDRLVAELRAQGLPPPDATLIADIGQVSGKACGVCKKGREASEVGGGEGLSVCVTMCLCVSVCVTMSVCVWWDG